MIRLGPFAYRDAILFSRPAVDAGTRPVPDGYRFCIFTADEIIAGALVRDRGRAERFAARANAGFECVGFRDRSDEICSYIWIGRGWSGPPDLPVWRGIRVAPGPVEAYLWDCRTSDAHAGRGLYRAGLSLAAGFVATEGARTVWIECPSDNVASRRGIEAAGFAPAARLEFYSAFGSCWWRRQGLLPRCVRGPVALREFAGDPPPPR